MLGHGGMFFCDDMTIVNREALGIGHTAQAVRQRRCISLGQLCWPKQFTIQSPDLPV